MGDARAELIADGGAGAATEEFFRSPSFHRAEAVTHTLRVTSPGRVASLAVIVRDIPGTERRDAVSGYGYPGATVSGDAPAPLAEEVDWSATGLVSVFARERLQGAPLLADPTSRGGVLVHDPARPRRVRRRLAEQIRAAARQGYWVATDRAPREADRAGFHGIYTETMRTSGAAERYFFDRAYLDAVLEFERSWLTLARRRSGEATAGAIAVVSDGYLHYFLGGTADAARAESPFKLVVDSMQELADQLRLPLNLGGGYQPGDGLERFKRGFANSQATFRTHEVVCDARAYAELSGRRDAGGFFPAYRAP